MSAFRFGLDDYGLSYYPPEASDGMGGVDWDKVESVEIEDDVYVRERTCEYKPMWNDDDLITGEYVGMWYTGCGDALIWNYDNDECCKPPAFCPYCGGKVKAVER